jgi:hypothetical protein
MHAYIPTYVHTYIHTYIHTHTLYIYIYIYTHTHITDLGTIWAWLVSSSQTLIHEVFCRRGSVYQKIRRTSWR